MRLRSDETCPKCGGAALDYQYKHGERRVYADPLKSYSAVATHGPDEIHLTCRRCGFGWNRAPLDAPAEQTTTSRVSDDNQDYVEQLNPNMR